MAAAPPQESDEFLPTRASLLERLKDLEDNTSWNDFFETYWKLIYSVARRTGLPDAEAQDIVQETIIAVAKKMEGFTYDPQRGSFKAWLKNLTQWRVLDFLRKKQYQVKGHRYPKEEALPTSLLNHQADPVWEKMERAWDQEWEQHLVDLALQRVKKQVNPRHYQLFYFHVFKEYPAKQVAERLKVKLGDVYSAKYRVGAIMKKTLEDVRRQAE